uniref:Transforming growth factor beta receptor 3 n=1 Tax=Molossus molossus TaxID=27622 RepID=A0A7J8FC81_MOLMO|nr:transforming growth factor beta receptor 3 [Molossus molossus]
MTSRYVIAMLALMSVCLATAGPEPSAQCELSPVNASHPVQALMESFTVLSGCASRGTTGLPQEVHVLNLRTSDQGPGQPQREVTLHLNPISSVHIHHKPVVFLLNSPQPLVWHLKTERLAIGVSRRFLEQTFPFLCSTREHSLLQGPQPWSPGTSSSFQDETLMPGF